MTSTAGVTYVYDGDGHRVEKSNGKLYWYGPGGEVLDETDLSGNITSEYVFFGGTRVARRDSSGNVVYYMTDHLGTSRLVTNASGNILDESDFYPFGGERVITSSSGNTYKFTGKERDSESNLDNFGARYNSSTLGRFMSPNPIGGRQAFPQSWNAYAYVLNNPLNAVDPTGLDCVYLNDAGNGIESIDQNSNAGECQQNGGAWADGTITNVTFDPNSNDVLLGYANMGNNGNIDYSQITATPGQFNPGDEIYGLANDINQMNLTSNIFKIYGAGAAVGATGGTACYVFCGSLGIGTVTTLGATVGGTAGPLVTDPRLQNIVNWLFQGTDELPGGTAGAVTYEQKMGDLLSQAGHMQKAQDAIAGLNDLLKSGTLSFNDQLAARQMIQQLQTAVATKPFGQN